jgi:hypothetical protein
MMIDFEDRDRAPTEPMSFGTKILIVIVGLLTAYGWCAKAVTIWHLVASLSP